MEVNELASLLKLFGDSTRLTMLKMLQEEELCVCEFVEVFDMSQPAISQHVRKLKAAGLVKERRSGQWIIYSLDENSSSAPVLERILKDVPSQQEVLSSLKEKNLRPMCEM